MDRWLFRMWATRESRRVRSERLSQERKLRKARLLQKDSAR